MKIHYIANARFPSEKAHSLQIAKTCEALANVGYDVVLVRPWRFNTVKGDLFEHYHIERNFRVVRLFSIDALALGYLGFWLQLTTFSISVFFYTLFHSRDIFYSRDELPLYFVSLVATRTYWESHTGRYNAIVESILSRIRGLIVITKGLADHYAAKGFPSESIVVAHDAVEPKDFVGAGEKGEEKARLGLPTSKKVALYIGRLDGWKGIETLCKASELLADDVVVALIGGEGRDIERFARTYKKVVFLGYRPYSELAKNQAAADVLILPNTAKDEISVRYTSPLKLFTYLLSKRPIIASDLPSIREVVSENEVYFFRPDDERDLASVITEVLGSGEDASRRAKRAWEVGQRHTWAARAKNIARIFS